MMQFITPRVPIFRQLCIDAYQIHIQNSLNLLEVCGVEVGRKVNIVHLFPNPIGVIHRLVHTCGIRFNDKEQIEDRSSGENKRRIKLKKRSSYPRIYTKTGDGGNSALFTGERRPKSDMVFSALGTTDELSSQLGLAREFASETGKPSHPYVDQLQRIQCLLQDVGSCLATPTSSARKSHVERIPALNSRHTAELEEWIDEYSASLPPLENFILPGGGKTSASLHVARSVCRRAERCVQPLVDMKEVDPEVLRYLNRLSDFIFTIARFAAQIDNKEETIYTRPPPADELSNLNTYKPVDAAGTGIEGVWKKDQK